MLSDEEYYLIATKEAEGEGRAEALWAKSIALCEGDEEKAKYKYIRLRVAQLNNEGLDQPDQSKPKSASSNKVLDDFSAKHMPVDEFSKLKGIPENRIIEMVRDGYYVGQIKDNKWYVSREELDNSDVIEQRISAKKPSRKDKQEYIPVDEFAELKRISPEDAVEKIRGGFYNGRIVDDKWHVASSDLEDKVTSTQNGSANFFSKLLSGDFGLPKTYWLFGVLGGLLFNIPLALAISAESLAALVVVTLVSVSYSIIIAISVWRASDKYQGPHVWAVLAKIAVIIGILMLLGEISQLVSILSS